MSLFGNKKTTAQDILKMIADLPESERSALFSLLSNPSEEADASAEAVPGVEGEADAESEADGVEAEPEPEPETEPAPDDANPVPDPTDGVEEVVEATEEAEESEASLESSEEAKEEQVSLADIVARISGIEESVKSLAWRLDANEAESEKEADDEDPFGYAFGPESKTAPNESEIEKAKRECGFNF